jgi:Fe-S cluster biogenesis protein NfuA
VTADGVVYLRFGGGCHGCGMADVTLKQGIEKTLLTRVPGVTAVRDCDRPLRPARRPTFPETPRNALRRARP